MVNEPCRLLCHAHLLGKLDGRNTFVARRQQIDRHIPLAKRQLAFAKHRLGADGEILFAGRALVSLAIRTFVNFVMAAMRAILTVAEARGGEVRYARFFIAEIIRELGQCFKLKYRFHSGIKLQ